MPWKGTPFGWSAAQPYLDFWPEAREPSLRRFREIINRTEPAVTQGIRPERVRFGTDGFEPPSIQLVAAMVNQSCGERVQLVPTFGPAPNPDPRKSISRFRLWKYRFKRPYRAVAEPSFDIIHKCTQIAAKPYAFELNWRQAGVVARTMSIDRIREILAAMVYPSEVPGERASDLMPWTWLRRYQLAVAQVVGQIEILQQVPTSRSSLLDIVNGPVDWVVDAALIALAQRVRHQPEGTDPVIAVISSLLARLPQSMYCSSREAAWHAILLIPEAPAPLRQKARQQLKRLAAETAHLV